MNAKVDLYFTDGCGRCPLVGTPSCKVNFWTKELQLLRSIVLDCGLAEELKWSVPCYTFQQQNILILAAFNDYCAISFFKGSLLSDDNKILTIPGENSQAARLIRFTDVGTIAELESIIKAYIFEAIEVENAGLKVDFVDKTALVLAYEFQTKLDESPALKAAFEALTPGRQRGYNLHFTAPKQSKTRESRIEKCIPKILEGRGFNE